MSNQVYRDDNDLGYLSLEGLYPLLWEDLLILLTLALAVGFWSISWQDLL